MTTSGKELFNRLGKSCYVVNRNVLSVDSFVASFKTSSLKSDFIQFFHDLIYVYRPGAGADSPPGDKILMSTERPVPRRYFVAFQGGTSVVVPYCYLFQGGTSWRSKAVLLLWFLTVTCS